MAAHRLSTILTSLKHRLQRRLLQILLFLVLHLRLLKLRELDACHRLSQQSCPQAADPRIPTGMALGDQMAQTLVRAAVVRMAMGRATVVRVAAMIRTTVARTAMAPATTDQTTMGQTVKDRTADQVKETTVPGLGLGLDLDLDLAHNLVVAHNPTTALILLDKDRTATMATLLVPVQTHLPLGRVTEVPISQVIPILVNLHVLEHQLAP